MPVHTGILLTQKTDGNPYSYSPSTNRDVSGERFVHAFMQNANDLHRTLGSRPTENHMLPGSVAEQSYHEFRVLFEK